MENNKTRPWTNFIKFLPLTCIIILIIICIYQENLINIHQNRIDTLAQNFQNLTTHKYSAAQEIKLSQFKEDYYLNQLNNSTSLILTLLGVSITLASLFSYKFFDDKTKVLTNRIELLTKDNINQRKKQIKREIEYNTLNITFCKYSIKEYSSKTFSNQALFIEITRLYRYYRIDINLTVNELNQNNEVITKCINKFEDIKLFLDQIKDTVKNKYYEANNEDKKNFSIIFSEYHTAFKQQLESNKASSESYNKKLLEIFFNFSTSISKELNIN